MADSAPQPIDTPLAKALTDLKLGEYAAAFDQRGYQEWADLGDDEESAQTSVEHAVPKDKPGVIRRIVAAWKKNNQAMEEANKPPEPAPAPKPVPKPLSSELAVKALTPGVTLDLTLPDLKIDDITFTIPDRLSVSAVSSQNIAAPDWLVLARKNKLLYGIHLDRALESSVEDGARAERAALVWKVPDSDDFVSTETRGSVRSSLCYTESVNRLVHHRIVGADLSVGVPFAAGAAKVTHDKREATRSDTRRLFMTGVWRYPMATLRLKDCTAASPAFLDAIRRALDTSPDQQFSALARVFDQFGHVMPRTVVLGGQLFFQSQRTVKGSLNVEAVTTTITTAVVAKAGGPEGAGGAEGSAGASFNDGNNHEVTAKSIVDEVSFSCVGGNTLLASNPKDWPATVQDPNRWAIIDRQGLTPLADWLDDADRERVLQIWNAGLRRLWNGHNPPEAYAYPDFNDEPFTITSAAPKQRYGPVTYTLPTGFRLGPAMPAHQRRALVGVSPVTALSNPAGNALRWRLVYTGATTEGNRQGLPLYWILAYPDERLLLNQGLIVLAASTFDTTQPVNVAVLLDHHEMQANQTTPEDSYATWTITVRNPSDYGSPDTQVTYQIQNFKTGLVLGPLYDQLENRQADPKFPKALASFGFGLPDLCVTLSPAGNTSPGTAWICAPCDADTALRTD